MSASPARLGLVALAMLVSACGDAAPPAVVSAGPADPEALDRAQRACDSGNVADGLATLDTVFAAGPTADALVARALCQWVEFDSTGVAEVGEAVEADFTSALAQARVGGADDTELARIYSHRAAIRRLLGGENWPATLADLNAAVEADTAQPLYVLDRAVAQMRRGDSAAAVRDLDRYLQLDTLEGPRVALARQLRDEVRPKLVMP